MDSQIKYIAKQIAKNNIELRKAQQIKKEIFLNKKYNLYQDDFILL